jgi:hypothetical protein
MLTDREAYRQTLIDLYLRLPETPPRLSRFDLRLVRQLWQRQIPPDGYRNRVPTGFRPPRRSPPRGDTPRTYSLPALLLTRDRGIALQPCPRVLSHLPADGQGRLG